MGGIDGKRILIVDDDPVLRRMCVAVLRHAGHEVHEADSGEQAVERFVESRADLVLLDVQMVGIDGYETCRQLRALPGGDAVPIIMLTGLDDASSIERAYETGATDFIAKPFQWPLLTQRVRYALRAAGTAEASRQIAASLARAQGMAQLGSWSIGLDGSMQCSAELTRILGLPAEQAAGLCAAEFLGLVAETDRARVHDLRQALAARGEGYEAVYAVQRQDGVLRTVYEQALLVRDARGEALHMEGITQDITDRVEAEQRIQQLASHDALTGLPNRDFLQTLVAAGLEQAREAGNRCAVLQLDIDRFKGVNDALGVAAGDMVLKVVARRLRAIVFPGTAGQGNVLGRVGANAFCIFVANAVDVHEVGVIAQRLISALTAPIRVADREIIVTARIGVALHPRDASESHALLRQAEQALYVAKRDANGSILFYDESISADASLQLVAETDLRRGLAGDEMRVFLQPKVDARSGAVIGAEALIRWQHPRRGLVSPGEFIPLAEKTGQIGHVSEWMLEQVCRLMANWQRMGLATVPVSVNISAGWFNGRSLADWIDQLLQRYQLEPGCIMLEVTESLLVRDIDVCIERMRELRDRGIAISLDDFGTGYSSLSYLKVMPLDELKLDRSFVTDIGMERRDEALAASVVSLAKTLDLTVVAEGVETPAQAAVLSAMGCHIHQGYLYGRPMPAASFTALLAPRDAAEPARSA